MEILKHDNAFSLASRKHLLSLSGKSSALIDEMTMSVLRRNEEWKRTVSATFGTLVMTEADLIAQERLKALDQKHVIQKLTLESNLRILKLVLSHELPSKRSAILCSG
jgi:hypothetical protein